MSDLLVANASKEVKPARFLQKPRDRDETDKLTLKPYEYLLLTRNIASRKPRIEVPSDFTVSLRSVVRQRKTLS